MIDLEQRNLRDTILNLLCDGFFGLSGVDDEISFGIDVGEVEKLLADAFVECEWFGFETVL